MPEPSWFASNIDEARRCHYCRVRRGTTRDHIVPKSKGGSNAKWNLVPACLPCNSAKANKWPTCPCKKCDYARRRFTDEIAVLAEEVSPVGNATDYFEQLLRDMKYGSKEKDI